MFSLFLQLSNFDISLPLQVPQNLPLRTMSLPVTVSTQTASLSSQSSSVLFWQCPLCSVVEKKGRGWAG